MKNFPKTYSEDDLQKLFEVHGEVLSCKIERDQGSQESKGFGFVCFADSECAKKAIDELNGCKFNDLELYVSRFEKKSERTRKLKLEMTKNATLDNNNKKTL